MGTPAQRFESERALYPAMNVDEILVWREFLRDHQQEYDRFDYNTHIGQGLDPGPDQPPAMRKMWIQLNQLRIDAVGWQGQQPTIFEVHRNGAANAIGQLVTYERVWRNDNPSGIPPKAALVCATINQNVALVARDAGIALYIVSVNFRVLAPQPVGRRQT